MLSQFGILGQILKICGYPKHRKNPLISLLFIFLLLFQFNALSH